jgi:hypothetical protein
VESPDGAGRPLTDFEQILLGVIDNEPRSGYGLKKLFNSSPASVYQPSSGALYPSSGAQPGSKLFLRPSRT